jgi:hypothetical protein
MTLDEAKKVHPNEILLVYPANDREHPPFKAKTSGLWLNEDGTPRMTRDDSRDQYEAVFKILDWNAPCGIAIEICERLPSMRLTETK